MTCRTETSSYLATNTLTRRKDHRLVRTPRGKVERLPPLVARVLGTSPRIRGGDNGARFPMPWGWILATSTNHRGGGEPPSRQCVASERRLYGIPAPGVYTAVALRGRRPIHSTTVSAFSSGQLVHDLRNRRGTAKSLRRDGRQ